MIEITEADITDIKEFIFLGWNKEEGAPYDQIKPLSKIKAKEVWKFALTLSPDNEDLNLNTDLFTKQTQRNITLDQWNDEANENEISNWLNKITPEENIFLIYQPDWVVMVNAKLYAQYWQIFDWPPGVIACSKDGKWFLGLHNDKFVIGSNIQGA